MSVLTRTLHAYHFIIFQVTNSHVFQQFIAYWLILAVDQPMIELASWHNKVHVLTEDNNYVLWRTRIPHLSTWYILGTFSLKFIAINRPRALLSHRKEYSLKYRVAFRNLKILCDFSETLSFSFLDHSLITVDYIYGCTKSRSEIICSVVTVLWISLQQLKIFVVIPTNYLALLAKRLVSFSPLSSLKISIDSLLKIFL